MRSNYSSFARLIKGYNNSPAEFAILISDTWHGHGLGTQMLRRLIEVAEVEEIEKLEGYILPENGAMKHICEKVGFKMSFDTNNRLWIARWDYRLDQKVAP